MAVTSNRTMDLALAIDLVRKNRIKYFDMCRRGSVYEAQRFRVKTDVDRDRMEALAIQVIEGGA